MKRGDIVIVAPPSPFNKPRPALVIQRELFENSDTVVIALITSDLTRIPNLRVPVHPTADNGLRKPSEVMIDNLQTVLLDKIGGIAGRIEPETLHKVDLALLMFLGLA